VVSSEIVSKRILSEFAAIGKLKKRALLRKETGLGSERRRKREIPSPVGGFYKPIPFLPKNVHVPIKSKGFGR